MPELELSVAAKDVAAFIHQVQLLVKSGRSKTAFGPDRSTHWIHSAIEDANHNVFPIVVTLEVRSHRTNGGTKVVRVFLTEVRPPQGDEISEGPYADQTPWSAEQARDFWDAIVHTLNEASAEASKPPPLVRQQRGYLFFYGQRILGTHEAGGWRLSTPTFPDDAIATIFSEQPIVCERAVAARSDAEAGLTFMSELEQLALLLSVFWCIPVRTLRHEQRWVIGKDIVDGQFPTELRQLGFTEPLAPKTPGADDGSEKATRPVDRLNPNDCYGGGGGRFCPPDDGMTLLQLFYDTAQSDPITAERFRAAAKAYHTSNAIARETATGAVAYLVVTAESLIDNDLPTCSQCHQKMGLAKAMRELVFQELSGLISAEQEVKRLLTQAYDIRSKHFHTGRFAAGELEPWIPSPILQPADQAISETYGRLLAVVNALLVAWLVKRTTGETWARATQPPPVWKDKQMFSVSFSLGGAPTEEA